MTAGETAYLALVAQQMAEDPAATTSHELLARHPELADHRRGAVVPSIWRARGQQRAHRIGAGESTAALRG